MSDSSEEHLNTDNKVLQQKRHPLNFVGKGKTLVFFSKVLKYFFHEVIFIFPVSKIIIFDFKKRQNAKNLNLILYYLNKGISYLSTVHSQSMAHGLKRRHAGRETD